MPVSIKIDGIDYPDQAPEVAKHIEKTDAALATATTEKASLQTKLDAATAATAAVQTKLDAANAEIAAMPAKVLAAAKSRADLVAQAKPHLDKADVDKIDSMSNAEIMLAVARKALPGAKDSIAAVKTDNADAVSTWYNAALATLKTDATDSAAAANRQAMNPKVKNDGADQPHVDSQEEWESKQLKHDHKGNRDQFLK